MNNWLAVPPPEFILACVLGVKLMFVALYWDDLCHAFRSLGNWLRGYE